MSVAALALASVAAPGLLGRERVVGPRVVAEFSDGVATIRHGIVDLPALAQRDVTVREPVSIHPVDPTPQPLECSGLAWIAGRLLLVSDRHGHAVFTADVSAQDGALQIGRPSPLVIVDSEKSLLLDAECVAGRADGDGWTATVFCSMSNDRSGARFPKREHAAQLRFGPDGALRRDGATILSLDLLRNAMTTHFNQWGIPLYESFNSDLTKNTVRWGNVEGIAWSPVMHAGEPILLCGLRNPLAERDAIVFALTRVDEAFAEDDASVIRVIDCIRLDLGGRGVSDLAWDPITGGFLVLAALSNGPRLHPDQPYPLERLDAALFWWSGDRIDAPLLVAQFPDMNMEAVCRVGDTSLVALGADEGDVSEERRGRQSTITLVHLPSAPDVSAPTRER